MQEPDRSMARRSALQRGRWLGAMLAVAAASGGIGGAGAAGTAPRATTTTAAAAASSFTPVTPVRVLDTRNGTGGVSTPVAQGQTINVAIAGTHGVPAAATGLVLNVTVVNGTGSSFLTVFPTGAAQPATSTLNWTDAQAHPNTTSVGVGTNGQVSFFNNNGKVDVLADVVGYYAALPAAPALPSAFSTGGQVSSEITGTDYSFVAPPTSVTLTAGQVVTGSAVSALGVSKNGTAVSVITDLCYQSGTATPIGANGNSLLITVVQPGTRLPYAATATISGLAAGTYNFGPCAALYFGPTSCTASGGWSSG